MLIATLNSDEQRLAVFISKERYAYNRKLGLVATVYGNRDPIEAEKAYYGAELCFCKTHNVYPDISHDKFDHKDCIYKGFKIDVKETHRPQGRLLVKVDKDWSEPPDYFALMIGVFPIFRFIGFMKATVLMVDERIDYTLPEPAWAALQRELTFDI